MTPAASTTLVLSLNCISAAVWVFDTFALGGREMGWRVTAAVVVGVVLGWLGGLWLTR